jgi:2-keto-4-pentenoate hydratase/2-oxohepta-3-ene-1,7-dioic acid hydratase in catechol pathway
LNVCAFANYFFAEVKSSAITGSLMKPPGALAGPFDDVSIHPTVQGQLDYESEMTVLIGKDGKNISEADALDYILGYTAGNAISARNFQLPDISGGQFCCAKSFDAFALIGTCIVSPALIPDPQKLTYSTKVNGEVRQKSGTDDMIWSSRQNIAHLSRGTTLRRGTAIMTGTSSGVGFSMKDKHGFLNDGDTVEVEISEIGAIRNKMVYEK